MEEDEKKEEKKLVKETSGQIKQLRVPKETCRYTGCKKRLLVIFKIKR